MESRHRFSTCNLFSVLLLTTLIYKGYQEHFTKHENGRLVLSYDVRTEMVRSAAVCCWMCSRDESCYSVSYNEASNECALSRLQEDSISGNIVTDSGWDWYSRKDWLLVFRAVAGNGMRLVSWFEGSPADLNDVDCKNMDEMSCSYYRHPFVAGWASIPHKQVKYALYKDGKEAMSIMFDGSRSTTLEDWFVSVNVLSSTWEDLVPNAYNFALSPDRSGSRHFQALALSGSCQADKGYTVTLDANICCGCAWDIQDTYPQFHYSTKNTSANLESSDTAQADFMTIWIAL